jgi:endonuclease/exonuclease/phosphatase family metal-dependent hydrolase
VGIPVLPARPDLAVVTWNLHEGGGHLDALVTDLRDGKLTGGRQPRDYILLLQEATPATKVDGVDTFFAHVRRDGDLELGSAILSSLPLANKRAIELPRERQTRMALTASVTVGGVDLLFVNVHLENRASWWKGGLPGDAIRGRQMEALLNQLPEGPGILGGDLNIWLGSSERAYQLAVARFPDVPEENPTPTFRERLALDHVLFRLPSGWTAVRARAPHRYGSDHFPIIAALVTH